MAMWTSKISPIVFTEVKTKGNKALQTDYPDIRFTTSNRAPTTAKFPTVYIHELPGVEQGSTLEGTSINAVLSSFQIDVTDNVSQNRVNEVMSEVVSIMKSMRFQVISMPEFQNTDDVYRATARFRRMIGAGDIDKLVTSSSDEEEG